MARFDYLEPHSLEEALQMLADGGEGTRLVAGSTDFLVRFRTGFWLPEKSRVHAARTRAGRDRLERS